MIQTVPAVPALAKPNPRAENRLYSAAIAAVAEAIGKDRLTVEDAVTEARGAITDMYRKEFYFGQIQRAVADLAGSHDRLIKAAKQSQPPHGPIAVKVRDPDFIRETGETMREMVDVAWEDFGQRRVSRDDVKLFINVAEETERRYLREHFDPSGAFDRGVLTLARAIYADFDNYAATMNLHL